MISCKLQCCITCEPTIWYFCYNLFSQNKRIVQRCFQHDFFDHVWKSSCRYIFSKHPFHGREDTFNYPPLSIADATLPFLKILQLLKYNFPPWITTHKRGVLPYLDCSFYIIITQISKILFTIVLSICNNYFQSIILIDKCVLVVYFAMLPL